MGELTVSEAAAKTGYSERHIRRLAQEEKIEARQVGNWLYLIDEASLDNYVAKMRALGNEKHDPNG
jgi:excisionase family DNA binding protein